MTDIEKKNYAADLLWVKAEKLGRLPKKSDFEPDDVSRIKAFLGPWPRALEYAGLKEVKMRTDKKNNSKNKKENQI